MREIVKPVLVLTLVCGLSAASLSLARYTLEPRIERQSDLFLRGPALERLLDRSGGIALDSKILFFFDDEVFPMFYSVEEGRFSQLVVEATGQGGYGGDVQLMFSLDPDGTKVLGVEIIEHHETPGVGSLIETEAFRSQWKGLNLDLPVGLRTQGGAIDGLSGATYSSGAMVDGTNRVRTLVREHRDEITAQVEEGIRSNLASGQRNEETQ